MSQSSRQAFKEAAVLFEQWAASVDQSKRDWAEDYPQWLEIVKTAQEMLFQKDLSPEELNFLSRWWAFTHEAGECADEAKENIQNPVVRHNVLELTVSDDPTVRWQAYDTFVGLPYLDADTQSILEQGLEDDNSYVRRRCFTTLRKMDRDSIRYFPKMLDDPDTYNRYVGAMLAWKLGTDLIKKSELVSENDPEVKERMEYYFAHKELIDQYD